MNFYPDGYEIKHTMLTAISVRLVTNAYVFCTKERSLFIRV